MTPSMTRTQVTNYLHHGASIIMKAVNLGADNVLLAVAETRRSWNCLCTWVIVYSRLTYSITWHISQQRGFATYDKENGINVVPKTSAEVTITVRLHLFCNDFIVFWQGNNGVNNSGKVGDDEVEALHKVTSFNIKISKLNDLSTGSYSERRWGL